MKYLIAFGLFLGSFVYSYGAHSAATSLTTNNGNKEQSESGGKDGSGKYTFALFNFFSTQTKTADDSTTVKKEEPAVLSKPKTN